MRFTNQEMLFLTSVSRGRVPFGVRSLMPGEEERSAFVEETIQSLMKKGVLDEKEKLTEEGAGIIFCWEQYRNSRRHIRLNHVNAAILPDNVLITVVETEGGYEVGCIRSEVLMTKVLQYSDYMCRAETKASRGSWSDLSEKDWEKELSEMEGAVFVSEYLSGRLTEERVYYWKKEKGYLFNRRKGRVRELSPGVMRKQLYRTLKGEVENGT